MNNKRTFRLSLPSLEGGVGGRSVGPSVWLFLELVIITVVAWVVFDPAIVNLYYKSLPSGYDNDRLLYAETILNRISVDGHYLVTDERKQEMIRRLESVEGIESVYVYDKNWGSIGFDNVSFYMLKKDQDTLWVPQISFIHDASFFETYGLKPLPGSPSAKELSHIQLRSDEIVLTRSAAISYFGTDDVVGKHVQNMVNNTLVELTVAGVVEDIRLSPARAVRSLLFSPSDLNVYNIYFAIRLKKGINPKRFVEEHGKELIAQGKTDYCRIRRLMTFNEHLQQMELDEGRPQEVNRSLTLALFFLVNLCLAVIGTVWLQARRKTEECGIRRAFGATRSRLLFSFLADGALMATVAVVIGCFIFLNYAYSGFEIANGNENFDTMYRPEFFTPKSDRTWVEHFMPHFLIVSGVVYLIILCTVLIGTTIPALKIIGTKVTDALRDE